MMTIILLYLLLVGTVSGNYSYYVTPDLSHPCLESPCELLDYYISNVSKYFTNNTCFIFLPGTHTLTSSSEIHSVTNVTLMTHEGTATIKCNNYGGLIFEDALDVKLCNLSFVSCGQPLPPSLQREGETAQAALAFGHISHLVLDSVSVSYSRGFGLLGHCVRDKFIISNSTFSYNNGSGQYLGGNAAIQYTNCSTHDSGTEVVIFSSNFTHGGYDSYNYTNYTGTLATGLMMILSDSNIDVFVQNVSVDGNKNSMHYKGFGGNMFIHFYNETSYISNSVTVLNSSFVNGEAWVGGGIGVSSKSFSISENEASCNITFSLFHSVISHNKGMIGGGLYMNFQLKNLDHTCPHGTLNISDCTFQSNQLFVAPNNTYNYYGNGAAVHIINKFAIYRVVPLATSHFNTLFLRNTFQGSYPIIKENDSIKSVVFGRTFSVMNVEDKLLLHDCKFQDNSLTALGARKSNINLTGDILIQNNTGISGGGLILCESSYIFLSPDTQVTFISNHAIDSGGAVYIEGECQSARPFCFIQFSSGYIFKCSKNPIKRKQIVMINNTAGYAGDHIYGGTLDSCRISADCNNSTLIFDSIFNIFPNKTELSLSAVTSNPRQICFCTDGRPNCSHHTLYYSQPVYPGGNITVAVVSVGQFEGTVPSAVSVSLLSPVKLPSQIANTMTFCTPVSANVSSTDTVAIVELQMALNIDLENTTYLSGTTPLRVHVRMAHCPVGFNLSSGICKCPDVLMQREIVCDITQTTIHRLPPAWIGYHNATSSETVAGIIYHEVCPYNYCNDEEVDIEAGGSTLDQDSQCSEHRTGVLCSQCQHGYSVSALTSDCIQCSNKVSIPLFLLFHSLTGLLLVLSLVIFDITYVNGTLSGLLFYANIIDLNYFIFYPRRHRLVIMVIMSLLNFSPTLHACFYDGMDSYAKAWLSFGFPLYYFLITVVLIVLCRKSRKLARWFSENIIKVLATLFLLSYTKLIQSVIIVLSPTVIQVSGIDNKSVRKIVWLYDPSVQYFSGKHLPLALVAIVFGLLILAYTLVLLFVQPLQRYSHLPCFSWMARLKPLIDAYTAPHIIKDNCRYWEGLLLFFRLTMAIAFAGNLRSRIVVNLLAISLLCVLLLAIAWSVGGIYKKRSLNILNSSFFLNLAALPIAVNYFIHSDHLIYHMTHHQVNLENVVYSSFAVALCAAVGILSHHVYLRAKKWWLNCKRFKYQILPEI